MSSEKPNIYLDKPQKQGIIIFTTLFAALAVAALLPKNERKDTTETSLETDTTLEKSLSQEEIGTSRQKKNEDVFAVFQEKIKNDPSYTPTRAERIALAKLGIAVNDGAPIPYEGDGNKE